MSPTDYVSDHPEALKRVTNVEAEVIGETVETKVIVSPKVSKVKPQTTAEVK